ncbi:MAG: peptidylprolyl isomerase [Nitrososphaerales archaeon]|nr:peptidylprolyl isomerase [Nitrososphaerales archaeon]
MPQKPRRRKQSGIRPAYIIAAALAVILVVAIGWYVYSSSSPPAKLVYARIDTSMGSFEVELFASSAPKTVANFVTLAESGFYNNLVWHRIEPNFVIQTGDPATRNGGGTRSLWGTQGSNTTVPLEIDPTLHNYVGYLGMARGSDPNSGTSQFYINLANNTSLDGNAPGPYTVFGKVISGMNVAQAIGAVPVELVGSQHEPVTPVYVTSITILSNGP